MQYNSIQVAGLDRINQAGGNIIPDFFYLPGCEAATDVPTMPFPAFPQSALVNNDIYTLLQNTQSYTHFMMSVTELSQLKVVYHVDQFFNRHNYAASPLITQYGKNNLPTHSNISCILFRSTSL